MKFDYAQLFAQFLSISGMQQQSFFKSFGKVLRALLKRTRGVDDLIDLRGVS